MKIRSRSDGQLSRIDTLAPAPLASGQRVNMRTNGGRFCQGRVAPARLLGWFRGDSKVLVAAAIASGALAAPASASADEPRSATEPYVMMESGEVTDVIDAFDDGDPFDINISLGFEYSTKSATIMRETHIGGPGLSSGGYTSNLMNVASYSESTSKLVPRIDIGIFRDLAAYIKLPIILSNSRSLEAVASKDGDPGTGSAAAQDVVLAGAPGDGRLFSLPFQSPDRSGLEYVAAGLQLDILSQHRDRTKPTWLLGVEGRFSVGEPMHACTENPISGQLKCANPADINRNGATDVKDASGNDLEGNGLSERDPGVSRGTIGLEIKTLMSKRLKYVEPYGGFTALVEFQQSSSDYGLTDLEGSLVNHPPLVGTVTAGLMIIPWENREKFGRLTFDLRVAGQYHSEGRDYSELFDALGSSTATTLRNPLYARYTANQGFNRDACLDADPATPCYPQSVVDQGSQKTYFTGLSDVQAYGSVRISGSATWQASEYVKFQFGMGFAHDQAHGISGDQPCNPEFKNDINKSGPCRSGDFVAGGSEPRATGVPNPNYRATINSIGRRFYVDGSDTFDIFASGTVMF